MIAALGIGQDGKKTILGIRQGATENATVVGELLGDLKNRGLDFTVPRLYVLDGGKALYTAVKKYGGESALNNSICRSTLPVARLTSTADSLTEATASMSLTGPRPPVDLPWSKCSARLPFLAWHSST